MRPVVPRRSARSGFTLVEIVVSTVILAVLATGFFGVIGSSRYLVSRQKRRLAAYELALRQIESRRQQVRADLWYLGTAADPLNPTAAWTAWANATVVNNVTYQSRWFIVGVSPGCADCPRRVTVQVRWNETRL